MAISPRLIKRRIRSINNTRKITRAMELVAAAKMRKAVQLAVSSRSYSQSAEQIVADIRPMIDPASHPLLAGRPDAKSSLVIVVGSNRGLCGGFNAQVLKKSLEFLKTREEKDLKLIAVGRRTELTLKRSGFPILAAFDSIADAPSFEKTRPVGALAYQEFIEGKVDRVFIAFMDFKSAINQIPTVKQILPIIPEANLTKVTKEEPEINERESDEGSEGIYRNQNSDSQADPSADLFEPNPRTILDTLLPRLIETELYQAMLEAAASEQSSRMIAMRNATENASEMMQDLTFTFNQARQAGITREISEISAGKAAIE